MTLQPVTKWSQIAVHGSRRLAQYGDRMYNLHEDVRYSVRVPSPCIVVLSELKPTLEENQQLVIDNINCDFALGYNTLLLQNSVKNREQGSSQKQAATYYLVAEDEPLTRIKISKDALFIGRDESCDIVMTKPQVSRRHCLVQSVGGKLRFRNLESTNGIYINGSPVRDGVVKSGDRITVGGCTFVIHQEAVLEKRSLITTA